MNYGIMTGNSFLLISFFISSLGFSEAQKAPAVYVFGDSLVDVGNNNYLNGTLLKAILPHYGIDFPTKKPTGRFSNGKNAADLMAEKLGLPTSPAYLSLVSKVKNNSRNISFLGGVNFASGGAGVFNGTDDSFRRSIPLTKQVDYYSQVHEQLTQQIGASTLQKHLSKSIFIVAIGSNDIFGYFNSMDLQKKNTPQQYVDSMVSSLEVQLQRLYNNSARKFEIVGVGAIGCCPTYRLKNKTECFSEANSLSLKYNEGLQSMLKEWQLETKDLSYSYFDTYAALQRRSIPLTKQVDYYSQVHEQLTQQIGASTLQKHLSKSIFIVAIGSNDIFGYFNSMDLQKKNTPQQYVDSMVSSLEVQLQRLYNNSARKFEIVGVGAIGCCPTYRLKNKTECFSEANILSLKYNEGLQSMLKEWQLETKDLSYSYFDTYAALQVLVQNPTSYGFADVKAACCGLGELNAQFPCTPISKICSNRKDHIFWDAVHPTEAATRIFVDRLFNGSSEYSSPINMEQLLAI